MRHKKKFSFILAVYLTILCLPLEINVSAADTRLKTLWVTENGGNTSIISIDVLKKQNVSYGIELTAPNDINDPTCLTSGYYTANGMLRLTADDKMIFSGNWIEESVENSTAYKKVSFTRNIWHNVRIEYNGNTMTATWYLDGNMLGTTQMKTNTPISGISLFSQSGSEYGLDWGLRPNLTDEQKNAAISDKYTAGFARTQGKNNWYFCEFGKQQVNELGWNSTSGRWEGINGSPIISVENLNTSDERDVGYKFVVPKSGVVRLRGSVAMTENSQRSDGVDVSIALNHKTLWNRPVYYGIDVEYDFAAEVMQGDEIYFKVNCRENNYYDWTKWTPTVEYTNLECTLGTEYIYYQKVNTSRRILRYDKTRDVYVTADNTSYINNAEVYTDKNVKLGRRYTVSEEGRYRIYGFAETDGAGGNAFITVLKNGKEIWSQMFPKGERGVIDIRLFATEGDKIDVDITTDRETQYEKIKWKCDITKFVGTLFCEASTSLGFSHITEDEFTLGSLVGTAQGENGAEFYSVKNDLKYKMNYSQSNQKWISTVPDSGGYISETEVYSGQDTDSIMEVTLSRDGILRIDGELRVNDFGDGVTSKIFLNDKLIWSSKVGGERPVRWDEPYDVSYFLNYVNTVAEVKAGDKLTFFFDQWRKAEYDKVNISNIKLKYVSGEILSTTTKQKIAESIVADTQKQKVYNKAEEINADIRVENETVYMEKSDVKKIVGKESTRPATNIDGREYLSLRDVLEDEGMNVIWVADRLLIAYVGIPVLFGYPELSEIETVLTPENTSAENTEIAIVDAKGEEIKTIADGEVYYIKALIENYVGSDLPVQFAVAYYDDSNILQKADISEKITVNSGAVYNTENMANEEKIKIIPIQNTSKIKVFVWNGFNLMQPYANCVTATK